ncbi:MAG: PAS domain S-box protein [Candidatus Heimdallarchaeota archaeon]
MESIESKLFGSEVKIKDFFNNIPIPSYVWQKVKDNFILIEYNTAAEKATNGAIKNYLGEKASFFYENKPELVKELQKCITEKKGSVKELKYTTKTTGEDLYLSIRYYFVAPDLVILHTEDITNRRRIEKELKRSEEKFRHLFQHSPYAIILVDLMGTILDFNDSTTRLFGYERNDLIGKNYLQLTMYPEEFVTILKARYKKALEVELLEPIELKITKKSGEEAWVLSNLSILKLGKKKLLHSIINDITEQKKFEETIKRKLEIERFLSTISSRFIGTIDIDMTINLSLIEMGRLLEANRAYLLLFNEENSLEFFTQQWCIEEIEPQHLESIVIHIEKYPWCLNQCKNQGFVYIPDTSMLPEEALSTKQRLETLQIKSFLAFPVMIKGELFGFIGFDNIEKMKTWNKEDFSLLKTSSEIIGSALERKWAEETLKNSNQLLAGIISSLTDPIFLIDKGFNILWCNNVAKNKFGLESIGNKCYEVLVKNEERCKKCIAEKTFSDSKIHERELNLIDVNGNAFMAWCTSSSAAQNLEGNTELAVLILRDLTAKKS